MATIFDGRLFAQQKEQKLAIRVLGLKTRMVYPKLASIIVGADPASELYVNLKKKAAERIGAEVDIYKVPESSKLEEILFLIKTLNNDKTVQGVMVQLPLPASLVNCKLKIVNSIAKDKDVDGLRPDSQFVHPTAKAIIQIIDEAKKELKIENSKLKISIVGGGMVGSALAIEIKKEGYDQVSDTKEADIVVSATGEPNIIKADSIKNGAVVIDVGSPKGDVEFESVSKKASFITPVPGGVGPVTITQLLENLISAC